MYIVVKKFVGLDSSLANSNAILYIVDPDKVYTDFVEASRAAQAQAKKQITYMFFVMKAQAKFYAVINHMEEAI